MLRVILGITLFTLALLLITLTPHTRASVATSHCEVVTLQR